MPAPKDKAQLTPWLKSKGYKWVLQSPHGDVVSVTEAIQRIEEYEEAECEAEIMAYEPAVISGCYPSAEAFATGHIWGGQHDDDTHEFFFFMDHTAKEEEQDGTTRYTFPDGVVLLRRDGIMELEQSADGIAHKQDINAPGISPF